MDNIDSCERCQYWVGQDKNGTVGKCVRYAPMPARLPQNNHITWANWPVTYNHDVCGEWTTREQSWLFLFIGDSDGSLHKATREVATKTISQQARLVVGLPKAIPP